MKKIWNCLMSSCDCAFRCCCFHSSSSSSWLSIVCSAYRSNNYNNYLVSAIYPSINKSFPCHCDLCIYCSRLVGTIGQHWNNNDTDISNSYCGLNSICEVSLRLNATLFGDLDLVLVLLQPGLERLCFWVEFLRQFQRTSSQHLFVAISEELEHVYSTTPMDGHVSYIIHHCTI